MEGGVPELMPELWHLIFRLIDAKDALTLERVCNSWQTILSEQVLWKIFHDREIGWSPQPPLLPDQWRESYKFIATKLIGKWKLLPKPTTIIERIKCAIECGASAVMVKLFFMRPGLTLIHQYMMQFLQLAAQSPNPEIFKILIEDRAHHFKADEFSSFLRRACMAGNLEVIKYLIEIGLQPREVLQLTLGYLPSNVHHVLRYLFTTESVLSCFTEHELNDAIEKLLPIASSRKGLFGIIELLLSMGAKPSNPHQTLLEVLGYSNYTYIPPADVALDTVLDFISQDLIESRQSVTDHQWNSVFMTKAVRDEVKGKEIIKKLVKKGYDINKPCTTYSRNTWTPLQIAASEGDISLATNLLACGADPKARLPGDLQALSLARKKGYTGVEQIINAYTSGKRKAEQIETNNNKERKGKEEEKQDREAKRSKPNQEDNPEKEKNE